MKGIDGGAALARLEGRRRSSRRGRCRRSRRCPPRRARRPSGCRGRSPRRCGRRRGPCPAGRRRWPPPPRPGAGRRAWCAPFPRGTPARRSAVAMRRPRCAAGSTDVAGARDADGRTGGLPLGVGEGTAVAELVDDAQASGLGGSGMADRVEAGRRLRERREQCGLAHVSCETGTPKVPRRGRLRTDHPGAVGRLGEVRGTGSRPCCGGARGAARRPRRAASRRATAGPPPRPQLDELLGDGRRAAL